MGASKELPTEFIGRPSFLPHALRTSLWPGWSVGQNLPSHTKALLPCMTCPTSSLRKFMSQSHEPPPEDERESACTQTSCGLPMWQSAKGCLLLRFRAR